MARFKDVNWTLPANTDGSIKSWEAVNLAVLMDIRDQLEVLNRVFACPNFQAVPQLLKAIKANTTKPKRKVKS